jgi:CRISPR-associated protein Cas1
MSWRSVFIAAPGKLSLKDRQLAVQNDNGTAHVPLEDISVLLIESHQVVVTSSLLSALAEDGVLVVSCDGSHLPNGVFIPLSAHSRHPMIAHRQLSLSEPQKKRMWSRIVSSKISNQAICLNLLGKESGEIIRSMMLRIRSGDQDNVEAKTAKIYFRSLFGDSFSRSFPSVINGALNYGYSIVRGAIARDLAVHGFLPAFGIFHRSERNPFNLVDDLIEPFRAIVDFWVISAIRSSENHPDDLTPEIKQAIVSVLHRDVGFYDGNRTVLSSVNGMIESFQRAVETGDLKELVFPILLSGNNREAE